MNSRKTPQAYHNTAGSSIVNRPPSLLTTIWPIWRRKDEGPAFHDTLNKADLFLTALGYLPPR